MVRVNACGMEFRTGFGQSVISWGLTSKKNNGVMDNCLNFKEGILSALSRNSWLAGIFRSDSVIGETTGS